MPSLATSRTHIRLHAATGTGSDRGRNPDTVLRDNAHGSFFILRRESGTRPPRSFPLQLKLAIKPATNEHAQRDRHREQEDIPYTNTFRLPLSFKSVLPTLAAGLGGACLRDRIGDEPRYEQKTHQLPWRANEVQPRIALPERVRDSLGESLLILSRVIKHGPGDYLGLVGEQPLARLSATSQQAKRDRRSEQDGIPFHNIPIPRLSQAG